VLRVLLQHPEVVGDAVARDPQLLREHGDRPNAETVWQVAPRGECGRVLERRPHGLELTRDHLPAREVREDPVARADFGETSAALTP
jgi:hypothetical protein